MGKYEAFGPDAEVLGAAISGFISATNRDSIWPHLDKLGMTEIQPDRWYPKQQYIDLWNSIEASNEMAMLDFVSIGMTIAETAWPPEFDGMPFDDVLAMWGEAFDTVNRGEDRGYIEAEKVNDRHYRIVHHTPDPDDLNYGVVYGVCKRFLPAGTRFTVYYDQEVPRREEGGEYTIIHIAIE